MSPAKIETEAKFIIPDATTFAALQAITRLGHFELKPTGVENVVDAYLDTVDKRLYRAGFACRIRRVKAKQILTLKSLTPATGNVQRRQEIELEIKSKQPQAWAEGEARRLVLKLTEGAALGTLFQLYQTRHKFETARQGRPVIELSLDEVALQAARTIDYFELEAELLETGTEADLALFIKTLQADWSLPPEPYSKFERALAQLNSW